MSMRINTNVQALQAQRALGNSKNEQSSSLQKLSSGQRINMAADDAAGLAISEKLKSEIVSTSQANRNAGDGISLIQTAEGGLGEVSSLLTRIRELSVQSASDTVSEEDRSYTNLEFQSLVSEVDRISKSTNFNGTTLLDGESEDFGLQIGSQSDPETNQLVINASSLDSSAGGLGIDSDSIDTKDGALAAIDSIDGALQKINGNRALLGSYQNLSLIHI